MIMNAVVAASDAVWELIPFSGNAVVHHNRVVTTYTLRNGKYRRQGVRIFDKIDEDPEMLKSRATFSNNADIVWAALQIIQGDGYA